MSTQVGPVLPKLIGERVRRREDPRLIQGLATYVDDVKLPGMLYMALKRSDIAHGNIRSIDTSAAAAMEGVELVLTGAELAESLGPMPIGTPFPAPDHHSVATDRVRYVGEPVAVVVAEDRYLARDAADAIAVEYEELPAVVDPEAAMAAGTTLIHDDFERNVAVDGVYGGTGVNAETAEPEDDSAVDAAFAEADVVIRQRMLNQRLAPNAMEPRGVVAHYEPGRDYITVWSATQNPHILRTLVAGMLGMGEHQVRAIAPEVGGGFGCKINIYGEEYAAAALSKMTGAPVKWIEDRTEAFLATTHGRDLLGDIEIAAKSDGQILAIRANLLADIGAYQVLLTAIIPTLTGLMMNGVYKIGVVRHGLTEVYTNKTPTDAYRGAGRPEALYFLERIVDMLARELDMDPAELRRMNFMPAEEFPYPTVTGLVYDSGDYVATLDKALEVADWQGMLAQRDAARAEGRVVGVGMSFYVEVCGLGTLVHGSDRGLGALGGDHRAGRQDHRHHRVVAARPGQRDHVRADAGRPLRGPDRGHHDPARGHRRRKAGHWHLRQPLAGGRRGRPDAGRRQGQRQDEAVRGRVALRPGGFGRGPGIRRRTDPGQRAAGS